MAFRLLTLIAALLALASSGRAEIRRRLVPVNLALSKPATASGSQEGHDPGQAVDGNTETRWCAPDGGNGYWWQVDLQKPEAITGCEIVWEKENGAYQYRIDGSADGQHWRKLVEENKNVSRPQTDAHRFSAKSIRYFRVTATKAPDGMWSSFWEVQVWGTNKVELAEADLDPRLVNVKIPPGFDATYFAGPTNVSYPTCISASPTGEVFVGVDQNGSLDTAGNRGWVVRCVDTNGDGIADQFNIFAKMDSPRGIVYDHHTLYVMHPPVLEAYYDDTGSGKANRSEVLVRGLAHGLDFRGADHTCNGVRLGIDGWLYIALGDYGALEAAGKDGAKIQLHGGGIVRVRTDGTGLEIFCRGTRNIYDVAIDPLMDIFTCDNTNDGDDWNVRLSHMIATANYGYPSLFRNFSDEMIATMADYGGGSPTGALFLDEPGFPDGLGYGLYCCQWGWDNVTRHPLQPKGASFTPEKSQFIHLPRPTGIDADGEGNIYVASWSGATFNYAGPNAGYVLRARPTNYQSIAFPDLAKTSDAQLIEYLSSPSAVWRLHIQREILRRAEQARFDKPLEKLAKSDASLPVRVAAMWTLEQLPNFKPQDVLERLAKDSQLRSYAVQALCDRTTNRISTRSLEKFLTDSNPAVRLQAVIGLNRLGRAEAVEKILPLVADRDPAVAHVAFRALVSFKAVTVGLGALRERNEAIVAGAMRVLRNLHEPQVVDGLIAAWARDRNPLELQALCRLYYKEADYDGSWWGTRPDTSGPYFKRVKWEKSAVIADELTRTAGAADETTLRDLLQDLKLHKIELTNLAPSFVRAATEHPSLREPVIAVLSQHGPYSKETITFLSKVIRDEQEKSAIRTAAFHGLQNGDDQKDVALDAFDIIALGKNSPLIKSWRTDFLGDSRNAKSVGLYRGLMTVGDANERELGYALFLSVAVNPNSPKGAAEEARQAITEGWDTAGLPNLLRAIGEMHATNYLNEVRSHTHDTNREVAAEATIVARELEPKSVTVNTGNLISKLDYAEAARQAVNLTGDPQRGAQLFEKLGCIKCHTISQKEPLKGPFLGDITKRYSVAEIIESILKPSAKIAQGFVTITIQTKDDSEYDGFIVRESGDTVEIRNLAGATVVRKKDIVKRGTRKISVMPEGLLDHSTPDDLAAVLAYLRSLAPK